MSEPLEIDLESPEANCKVMAQCEEEINHFCSCKAGCQFPAYEDNPVSSGQLEEVCVSGDWYLVKGFDQTLRTAISGKEKIGLNYWEFSLNVLKLSILGFDVYQFELDN